MSVTDLHALLKHELGDLLYAEKTILKALKKMAREVSAPDMRERIVAHQGETEQQIQNLERAFEAIGERARAQKCPGILGIVQEHEDFVEEEEPSKPILEAFDLGAGLRIEHYEIAGYRSAIALAKSMRRAEVVELLRANLEQEVAMAKFIEGQAAKSLQGVSGMLAQAEGETPTRGARKTTARKAAAKRQPAAAERAD